MPRWRMSPTDSAKRSASTGRIRWPSTFRASCSPRITTSSTSSRRALSAPPISTPIRGCAWPPAWSATSAPSAATRFPAAMKIWNRPTCWCWSAPTPPGAIRSCTSACWRRRAQNPRLPHRRHRPAPDRDLRGRRSASAAALRQRLRCCSTDCWRIWRRPTRVDRRLRRRIHHRRGGRACAGRRPDHHAHRNRLRADAVARSNASSTGSPKPSASSRSIRKASTSRAAASTRSMRSSTAICSPAASDDPAWGRSRSPASPMRWAAAKSAGSPISSPPIWRSRTRSIATSCSASGARL